MNSKFSIFIVLVLILSFSVIGSGFSITNPGPQPPVQDPRPTIVQSINAQLATDMGFMVDGQEWQAKDVDGTILSPIIYKGRSYVPVRALLEAKGVQVSFDENTRTIILNYPEP